MSMLTDISFTNAKDTRVIIDEVMEHAFESVCSTMGPNGRYVVINQLNKPRVTKDGVSVAKALDFNETRKNLIANIIMEPSIKTDVEVGDGTTTTVFMTYKLYNAFKDKMTFRNLRYLDDRIGKIIESIGALIKVVKVEDPEFRKMLLTSSNYEEEIVDKILEIYKEHKSPNIRLMKAPQLPADEIKFTREITFDGNYAHENYVPQNQNGSCLLKAGTAAVIIVDGNIQQFGPAEFSRICEAETGMVVLMARNFDPMALAGINAENQKLRQSNPQSNIKVLPYKLNAGGTLGSASINDLGKLLDCDPIFDFDAFQPELLKVLDVDLVLLAKLLAVTKDDELIKQRAEPILETLDERYDAFSIMDRQQPVGMEVARRIGRLRANNVIINVTGVTVSDTEERYYRYEDVMKAAKTGLQFGVIPGIGYGYLMARQMLENDKPAQSDEELNRLHELLMDVLTSQYEHLTGNKYTGDSSVCYVDMVTGEETVVPNNVYDNAAATLTALKGAWATAKTLGKISNVMGKSNSAY
ncbi:putative GroEL like chaperonine protein [Edwardsiella phage pEt-SU]|uniref:Putative GroEL like chaperonine protein n=1 Tax=Edwardsiella phage pEt-SU TaxID=2562142 RepID=A0A4D6DWN3_9CAUD|nr:chaperonin groEL [Edwardsiella phage pEt-SU]QBZ70750.1 putative GroEL like chaperonine protein [Edwardsiella phage pEt-SU]